MNIPLRSIQTFTLLILAFAPWSLGIAQDSDSGQTPPPSPPYVADLSGDFNLVKKFTYLSPDASTTAEQKAAQNLPTNPKEIDAAEKGAVRKDKETFVDGTSRDIWRLQSYRFTVYAAHPDGVIIDFVTPGANGPNVPYHYQDASDFPELSWVTGAAYQGVQMRQDKKCYTYKLNDQTAWIDVTTHLPVYLESKTIQVTYTFSTPPDEPLELPKGYAEKLEKFKRAQRGQL